MTSFDKLWSKGPLNFFKSSVNICFLLLLEIFASICNPALSWTCHFQMYLMQEFTLYIISKCFYASLVQGFIMPRQVKPEGNITIYTGHHTDGWLVSGSKFIGHRF